MTTSSQDFSSTIPIWARQSAFPKAPSGWGWVDPKGKQHSVNSLQALIEVLRDDVSSSILLAWTPLHSHMIVPESVEESESAIHTAKKRGAASDWDHALWKVKLLGATFLGFTGYAIWQIYHQQTVLSMASAVRHAINKPNVGIAFLLLLIMGLIPAYQACKSMKELQSGSIVPSEDLLNSIRFETWLSMQRAPITKFFLVLITVVQLVAFFRSNAVQDAGLVKQAYLNGDWWRIFTAPYLHGNIVHFLMNASALLYLGKRTEIFARWPHVAMVFLLSATVGTFSSLYFLPAQGSAVGASGGLMGWLGFLLVFETLHGKLVPLRARKRLIAGIVLTALIGICGYQFIDNAAHLGGLLAGIGYAAIVFPKSESVLRPKILPLDRVLGIISLVICATLALLTLFKIL